VRASGVWRLALLLLVVALVSVALGYYFMLRFMG